MMLAFVAALPLSHARHGRVVRLCTRRPRVLQAWGPVKPTRRRERIAAVAAKGNLAAPPLSPEDASASLRGVLSTFVRLGTREPFIVRRIIAAFICVVSAKLLTLAVPLQFKRAVDALSMGSSSIQLFTIAVLLHLAASTGASLARDLQTGIFARAGQRVGRRLTLDAFAHILSQDAGFHAAAATGTLTRIVDRGTRSIMTVFRGLAFNFLPTIFELLLVCVVLWRAFAPWYAFVTLIVFFVYVLYTLKLNDTMSSIRTQMNMVENESGARLADAFFNVDSISAFNNFNFEAERYDTTLERSEELATRFEWMCTRLNFGQGFIFMLGLTTMLWRAGVSIASGTMSIGSFVLLYAMLQQLWVPLNFLGWHYREVRQSLIDLQNLFTVLQRRSIVAEIGNAKDLFITDGAVQFDDVSFAYPKDEDLDLDFIRKPSDETAKMGASEDQVRQYAIKNLSFKVEPGTTLALVGPSGSGKSSTLKLLYRLFDVSDGVIRIDDQDISKVTLSSLRDSVSIVPQDTALFFDTIAYNIRYGRPTATDAEVISAAKAASIHDTIMRTPNGYQTLVGERGVRLSGGERQRLSVARAFLKGAKIVMEDESTSALDSAMEMEVTKALKELGQNRTRIVIAHRLSTIADADTIIVIRDGEKVEQGPHQHLLSIPNGLYRELWRRQQDKRDQDFSSPDDREHERSRRVSPVHENGSAIGDVIPGGGTVH